MKRPAIQWKYSILVRKLQDCTSQRRQRHTKLDQQTTKFAINVGPVKSGQMWLERIRIESKSHSVELHTWTPQGRCTRVCLRVDRSLWAINRKLDHSSIGSQTKLKWGSFCPVFIFTTEPVINGFEGHHMFISSTCKRKSMENRLFIPQRELLMMRNQLVLSHG